MKVDPEDLDLLYDFNWTKNCRGHYIRNNRSIIIILHREIAARAGMEIEGLLVDHKDLDTENNTRSNLRPATNQQNQFNTGSQRGSRSRHKGVTWDKHNKRWLARIRYGKGQRKYLGSFLDEDDAGRAYNDAAIEFHGEFARLNKI